MVATYKYMDVQGFSHKPGSAFEAYHKTDPSKYVPTVVSFLLHATSLAFL